MCNMIVTDKNFYSHTHSTENDRNEQIKKNPNSVLYEH